MTPEFHKNPIKFRYIYCTSRSTNKNVNITLHNMFKKIYGFLKYKFKMFSYFWSIDNSLEVLDKLNFLPHKIQVFFENLFNNISINCLLGVYKNIFDLFYITR